MAPESRATSSRSTRRSWPTTTLRTSNRACSSSVASSAGGGEGVIMRRRYDRAPHPDRGQPRLPGPVGGPVGSDRHGDRDPRRRPGGRPRRGRRRRVAPLGRDADLEPPHQAGPRSRENAGRRTPGGRGRGGVARLGHHPGARARGRSGPASATGWPRRGHHRGRLGRSGPARSTPGRGTSSRRRSSARRRRGGHHHSSSTTCRPPPRPSPSRTPRSCSTGSSPS